MGPKFHTAKWRHDVNLEGKKVAVIGTGASAVQVVPNIAEKVSKLTVFQRTPAWVPERFDHKFPLILQSIFAAFPFVMRVFRAYFFWRNELRFHLVFDNRRTWVPQYFRRFVEKYIQSVVKDPETAKKLTPSYELGCKRITPSDTYLKAFNLDHVNLITDKVDRFDESGIITVNSEGKETKSEFDVIILATGNSLLVLVREYF